VPPGSISNSTNIRCNRDSIECWPLFHDSPSIAGIAVLSFEITRAPGEEIASLMRSVSHRLRPALLQVLPNSECMQFMAIGPRLVGLNRLVARADILDGLSEWKH
jgi:hypothetical protein